MLAHRSVRAWGTRAVCIALLVCSSQSVYSQTENVASGDKEHAVSTAVTSLPSIDPAIHDAMQSRSYVDAAKRIEAALADDDVGSPDYLRYLQGVAMTEAQKYDEAISAFSQLEKEYPESEWISRARFGRANVFVLRRQYIKAVEIYAAEAERLLSRGRKDTLANIYLEFADRYFDGIAAKDPSKAKQPDYKQALTFYSEAVKLGPTLALRQRIEFRIARCYEELAQHAEATAVYRSFLRDFSAVDPLSGVSASLETRTEAKYRLGGVQLTAGLASEARATWQDLLKSSESEDAGDSVKSFLSLAQYRMAHTYGLPNPRTVGDLELAVTVAESFLADHPDDKLAPKAVLEIAQGYSRHGRHIQAADRLRSLLENPRYKESKQIPVARQMLGQELLVQGKFDEAIESWKEFLEQHPTDPKWPSIQKRIVDTEYAKAEYARGEKKYDEARTLWQTFLNKHPLDSRAAFVLFQFGAMKSAQAADQNARRVEVALEKGESAQSVKRSDSTKKLLEEAISDWRRVASKYPGTAQASHASFMIGVVLEDRLGRLAEALESYKKVKGKFASQANGRRTRLTTPQLQLITERKFRSDEKPRIKLTTRNLEKVTVKAYRIDMTDYFRKMHLASGIETLDIALIDPDEQFEHAVGNYADYKAIIEDIELSIDGPGVTAITVSSENLEATTMVVVSDLDMIVKTSRNELFLFVENMREQTPMEGVSILISDGEKVFAEELTGPDGILQKSYDELKSVTDLRVFAVHEGQMASTVSNLNGLDFAVGLTPRGYVYTDRPAYRGGQLVNIKAMVRWVEQDRLTVRAGQKFQLDIYDSRGRMLQSKEVTLNDYGTVNSNIVLPTSAAQGNYRVHLHRASSGNADNVGALSFETGFTVTDYKIEPIQLSVDLDKDVYFRGEKVKGTIELKYYYGTPLAGETIQYQLSTDGEQFTAKTDEAGKIAIELETQRFSESQPLVLTALYPDRGLRAATTVYLATRGFAVAASSLRSVYINGEPFETIFTVADPAGNPVETDLKIEVFQQITTAGQFGEKLIQTLQQRTDKEHGVSRQTITLDEGGMYSIRATGRDQFGNQVSGQNSVRISGNKDTTRLRILADRLFYKVGEEAEFNLHWREQPALALVTFEGATVLGHRLVQLAEGDNALRIPMTSEFAPNVFVSVAVMQRNRFHSAQSELQVSQELRITLEPVQKKLKPGENLDVNIRVTDPQGKPVQAEISLAVVQTNLLNLFQDMQGSVNTFFNVGHRRPAVRQSTSCTFSYHPRTRPISQFLLAETDRRETLSREVRALAELGEMESNGDVAALNLDDLFESTNAAPEPQSALGRSSGRLRAEVSDGRNLEQSLDFVAPQPDASNLFAGGALHGGYGLPSDIVQHANGQAMPNRSLAISTVAAPDPSFFDQSNARYKSNDLVVNGLTATGKFLALNSEQQQQIEQLQREEGFQILPGMAHAETAFWDPTIVTDEAGKATATIQMPMRSTAWKLRAKGINQETLAGQADANVITKKELFGELQLPMAFTVGDKASIPVEVHNSLEGARSISVKLKATLGEKSVTQSKTIKAQGPGISKVTFAIEIEETDNVEFELLVTSGEDWSDRITRTTRVQPYGFPVYQTASGTSAQSTLAMIDFDKSLEVQVPMLEILIGASIDRSLLDNVRGGSFTTFGRCGLPTPNPIERSISDVIAGVPLMKMIGHARDADTPEAQTLSSLITAAVTQLVSAQHEDGGWTWTGNAESGTVDALLSSRVMWALSAARSAGFAVSEEPFEMGKTFLKSTFASSSQSDLERQTILLHAMSVSGCGEFAFANRLYRERNRLSPSGLTHLALALSVMNHKEMASDLIKLIPVPIAAAPVPRVQGNIDTNANSPWMRSLPELQALYLLVLQEVDPVNPNGAKVAKALMASRIGDRWAVEKVNGPAVAALAKWRSRTSRRTEKYRLVVSVNDKQVASLTIDPSKDGGRRIEVPSELIRTDGPQRIEFKLDGRGTFSYSAVLTGFVAADKIVSTSKDWMVGRRYEPAQRIFDGHSVPRGFDVINGSYKSFANPLTQLAVGDRGEVTLYPRRRNTTSRDANDYDYLVLTEPLPAGCTVLDGSVSGDFERFEIEPGKITFFIGNRRYAGDIRYTLVGYVPGKFRVPQTILRSFYDPAKFVVSKTAELRVLNAGSATVDEYRLTPDEKYYLGQKEFEKKNFDAAHTHLSDLFDNWNLDADKFKNVVSWLFASSLAKGEHGDTVKYFEVLKEKFPDVEISFEDILQVARAYREIGEYERGYLVYRATVEGSFERESQVAGFLNARGEFIRSVQAMERLLRDYPAESYVATASYALAQETYRRAPSAAQDPQLKEARLTRVHLIDGAIKMLDHFVTTWPQDPADDQASFALATALIDLEQYDSAIQRSEQYVKRYPKSRLLDSYWYIIGYSHFELEQPQQALEMCRKVAEATFPVSGTGGTRVADNRWEAIYIMGQIYHSLGQATNAIAEYTKVKERFADATEAIRFFNRKEIAMEEITTLQPNESKNVELRFRNIRDVAIKVYRIDLMKFGLMQRNLDRITAINLAGIKPYHEQTVPLGDGKDFRDRRKQLSLPLKEEGAYLIVCRGENLYASGLVLVSPLELLVQEDATSGRVRVSVKDTKTDSFVNDVHVKVIGSANDDFVSGDTDLRGLFIADDIQGTSTVIAVRDKNRYAFYRGEISLQGIRVELPSPPGENSMSEMQSQQAKPAKRMNKDLLRGNLFQMNRIFQQEQQDAFDGLLNNDRQGIKSKEAY